MEGVRRSVLRFLKANKVIDDIPDNTGSTSGAEEDSEEPESESEDSVEVGDLAIGDTENDATYSARPSKFIRKLQQCFSCPPRKYTVFVLFMLCVQVTWFVLGVIGTQNGNGPWLKSDKPLRSHFERANWQTDLYLIQTVGVFLASILGDIFVVTFHLVVEWPHPKFRMRLPRQLSITTHITSGITEISAGVAAFFAKDPRIAVYVMCGCGLIGHTISSFYQTPQVFGAKRVMIPAYVFCIVAHVLCLGRLIVEPTSLTWLIRSFGVLHIYVWCRIFFILFYFFEIFKSNLYTAAILAAGLVMLPVLGPSLNLSAVLFICLWNCVLEIPYLDFDMKWWTQEFDMASAGSEVEIAQLLRAQASLKGTAVADVSEKTIPVGTEVRVAVDSESVYHKGVVLSNNKDGSYDVRYKDPSIVEEQIAKNIPRGYIKKNTDMYELEDSLIALGVFMKYVDLNDPKYEGWEETRAFYAGKERTFYRKPNDPLLYYYPIGAAIELEKLTDMLEDFGAERNQIASFLRYVDTTSTITNNNYKPAIDYAEFYENFWHADHVYASLQTLIISEGLRELKSWNTKCMNVNDDGEECECSFYRTKFSKTTYQNPSAKKLQSKCYCGHTEEEHTGKRAAASTCCFQGSVPKTDWEAAAWLPDSVKAKIVFHAIDSARNNDITARELFNLMGPWGVEMDEAEKIMDAYGTKAKNVVKGSKASAGPVVTRPVVLGDLCKPPTWSPKIRDVFDKNSYLHHQFVGCEVALKEFKHRDEYHQFGLYEELTETLVYWYKHAEDAVAGESKEPNKYQERAIAKVDKLITSLTEKMSRYDSVTAVVIPGLELLKDIGILRNTAHTYYAVGPFQFAILPESFADFEYDFSPVWMYCFERFLGANRYMESQKLRRDQTARIELLRMGVSKDDVDSTQIADPLEDATCLQKACGCFPCCSFGTESLSKQAGLDGTWLSVQEDRLLGALSSEQDSSQKSSGEADSES